MTLCEFQSYRTLEKPDTKFDISQIISCLLFIFGLSILGSHFVFSPGISIKIPKIKNIDLKTTSGILNIGLNGLLMFNNHILKLEELTQEIEDFLSHKKSPATTTLLVIIDQSVPFGFVVQVTDTMRSAGCKKIQIACESKNILNFF